MDYVHLQGSAIYKNGERLRDIFHTLRLFTTPEISSFAQENEDLGSRMLCFGPFRVFNLYQRCIIFNERHNYLRLAIY